MAVRGAGCARCRLVSYRCLLLTAAAACFGGRRIKSLRPPTPALGSAPWLVMLLVWLLRCASFPLFVISEYASLCFKTLKSYLNTN